MARRWLPIALALGAAAAEADGAHVFAFYLVLVAVPLTAACALVGLGELLDMRARGSADPETTLQPFLSALALLLLVGGAAAGALALAVSGCLAVYSIQALVGLARELRRPAREPILER